MKCIPCSFFIIASILCTAAVSLMTGCTSSFSMPDATATAQGSLGVISGSNFGGHAPIVNAKVFLLQASTSGYGTKATSLLTSAAGGVDTTIVGTALSPAYYVTTDNTGNFSFSGDYTCTAGLPVYLYAYGGAPDTNPSVGPSVLSSGTWSTTSGTTTFTFTVDNEKFYTGQLVTFTVYSGQTFSGFNGQSFAVTSVNPSGGTTLQNTQFSVVAPDSLVGNVPNGSGTFSGYASASPIGVQNPAIVNLAVLGNCPSTGPATFGTGSANSISYVYMNEVSTVAAAFALAPFAETSTTTTVSGYQLVTRTATDAQHIGIPAGDSLALTGIQNAANNAGQLYDITGATNNSSNSDGEAHVARTVVPGSVAGGAYATVPQALINTLGNILASCVDSANTKGLGVSSGSYSTQCSTLFSTATADGTTQGTPPTDIATAAINIAHYPAGVGNSSFMSNLFNLPVAIVPFQPTLNSSQPNDFTIGINITDGSTFLGTGVAPKGIAIDASGNAFVPTTGCVNGCTVELGPTQLATGVAYSSGGTAVAVAPNGKVWVVNGSQAPAGGTGAPTGAFYVSSTPLTSSSFTGYGSRTDFATGTVSIAIDGNGVAYVGDSAETYIHKISTLGVAPAYTQYLMTGQVGNLAGQQNCEADVAAIAVDSKASGYNIWTVNNAATATQGICTVANTAASPATTATSPVNTANVLSQIGPAFTTGGVAIDANGSGWDSNANPNDNSGVEFGPSFADDLYSGNYGFANGGGLSGAVGVAVDGNDNVWYANSTGNSVTVFKNLGPASILGGPYSTVASAISPTTGYTASGQMSAPARIAIDPSGDVWVTNTGSSGVGYSVTELIGAAAPTYTPLSSAALSNKLGSKP
jgi:hypothetical protein